MIPQALTTVVAFLQFTYIEYNKIHTLVRCVTLVGDQPANYINLSKGCVTNADGFLDFIFPPDQFCFSKPCASINKSIKSFAGTPAKHSTNVNTHYKRFGIIYLYLILLN